MKNNDIKKMISFRVDPSLDRRLRREAKAQQRPLSWLIEFYIKAGLGIAEPPTPTVYGQQSQHVT